MKSDVKRIVIMFLFITNAGFSQDPRSTMEVPYEITVIELVCNSTAFDNKKVILNGYFDKEGYLFFTKDDYTYSIYRNSLKLSLNGVNNEILNKFHGKYIKISGVFYDVYKNRFSGHLGNLSFLVDYEELLLEKKADDAIRNKN